MPTVNRSVLVPYAAERMFALVERVEDYPEFLPWCGGARVHSREPSRMVATLLIDYRGLRQSFTTENLNEPERSIRMQLREGPFKRLDGHWRFSPLRADASKVELSLDYAFSATLVSRMLSPVFDQIAATFVDAFVQRADAIYG